MKARALILNGTLITVWNGEEDINLQIIKFIEENEHTILDDIEYCDGGTYDIEESLFHEYIITISGDNGIMTFESIIYEI